MIKNIMKNIGTKPEALNKSWSQEDVIKELPKGWRKEEGVLTTPNGYVAIGNVGSRFDETKPKKQIRLIKQEDYEKSLANEEKEDVDTTEDSPTPEAWKTSVIAKLDTPKLLEMDKNFENYKKTMNSVDKLAQERNDIVKAELKKRNSK